MGLREMAFRAAKEHRDQQARRADDQSRRVRQAEASQLRGFLRDRIGFEVTPTIEERPDSNAGFRAIASIDGMTFTRDLAQAAHEAYLLWQCPQCAVERAKEIRDLIDLGNALADESWHEHRCPPPQRDEEGNVIAPPPDPNSLPARAIAEYEAKKQENDDRENRRLAAVLKGRMKNALGLDVEPAGPSVTVDGVTFFLTPHYSNGPQDALTIETACARCGRRVFSRGINSLEDLGAVLKGEHIINHYCAKEEPESVGDRLLDAIIEAVREAE